jgi:hypothetical protein
LVVVSSRAAASRVSDRVAETWAPALPAASAVAEPGCHRDVETVAVSVQQDAQKSPQPRLPPKDIEALRPIIGTFFAIGICPLSGFWSACDLQDAPWPLFRHLATVAGPI